MPDDPREMERHELESFARGWDPNTLILRSNGYSGPDIKLIAHLRGESTSREQLNALIREREELVQRFRLSPLDGAMDTRTEEQRAAVEETWADEDRERLRILGEQIEELEANQLYTPRTKVLAEIQTLSISTHRDKGQVRPLGSTYPRSITRGPRTIGGSMVVAVFYEHVFASFLESAQFYSTGAGDYDRFRNTAYLPDQMPPLDISISFANEYGNFSWMALLGVEIINEGMVLSVMDIFTENTFQYIARDIDPLRAVGRRDLPITNNDSVQTDVTGSELTRQDFIRRSAGRRNPFI